MYKNTDHPRYVAAFAISAFVLVSSVAGYAPTHIPVAPGQSTLTPMELAMWNDPAFKKAFIESYLARTEVEPLVTTDEREEMLKILDFIQSDKMDKAAAQLEEKVKNKAATAVYDFTLANIYFQQEKLDEAAAAYQVAVDKYPKFLRAWKNMALIHVRQNNFEKALPALTRVVELGGGDTITYGLLGYAYSSTENHISAESAYRMAILLDPATLDWKMGLARSLFKQEKFAEAITLCGKLIENNPERADLWLLQANAYIGLNQPVKAAEIYEMVDLLGQSTVASLTTLADIYVNEELYDLAVNSYIRAINKDAQKNADRAIRAAKVLAARGVLDETGRLVEHIERVCTGLKADDRKDLLKLRARIAVANGSGEQEVRVLKEIVELDPLDGEAMILLGQNSERAGDLEQAVFYYERAEAIESSEADAKVRHAQLLVKSGKYAEALPLLRRAQIIKRRDNIQQYIEQVERVAKTQQN